MQKRYELIIWDWNGTLFNDAELCLQTINGLLGRRGLAEIRDLQCYREIFTFPVRDYYEKAGLDFSREPFETLAEEYMGEYHGAARHCSLFPEAERVINWLRGRGVRQVIVSASRQEALEEQVDWFPELSGHFEALLGIGDSLGGGKSGVAERYLREQGVALDKVLFIGDTVHDFEIAQELGCGCVLTAEGHQSARRLKETGAPVLNGIGELPEWLEGQESGIVLRPLRPEDTDAVFAMTSDPAVAEFMRFDTHTERAQAEDLICEYTKDGNLGYLIMERDGGAPVGVTAMKQDEDNPGVYSLSIFLSPEYWGKGVSTHATRLLVEEAGRAGAKKLLAYVVAENMGSRRVMEKCGFRLGSVLHFDDLQGGLYVYHKTWD